jgi:putative molybdopterin biosynthesis protein
MPRKKHTYLALTSLDDARAILLALAAPMAPAGPLARTERIDVRAAAGRVLARGVHARRSNPHFACAAMDGIAVRARNLAGAAEACPVFLPQAAGAWADIDTGDPVPPGFDAVVMEEGIARDPSRGIEVREPVAPWDHVRLVGEDLTVGDLLVPAYTRMSAYDVGGCLAAGILSVDVLARPRVRIIPTGDEIVAPGREPAPGEIVEFNGPVLAALVAGWGGEPDLAAIVPDDPERIGAAIREACAAADIVLVIAGSSAGRGDHVPGEIARAGRLSFHGVMMMPGKPVAAGTVADRLVMGLPGYPASCYLVAEELVRPVIARLLAQEDPPATVPARVLRKVPSRPGMADFVRVHLGRVRGEWVAVPGRAGAGSVASLFASDGVFAVPALSEGFAEGRLVGVRLLRAAAGPPERNLLVIGSHDPTLDLLREHLRTARAPVDLSVLHVGSFGGLMALKRGECHVTFLHLLDAATGEYNTPYLARVLSEGEHVQVAFVRRHQGLIVARGNPRGIGGLADVARPDVTFINRQAGAGTRVLLDHLLARASLDPASVRGYGLEVYTHAAVAASVAAGTVDVGLGIRSVAGAFGLDFVPLAWEDYDLVCAADQLDDPRVAALIDLIRSRTLADPIEAMGGYQVDRMGVEVARVCAGDVRRPR